MPLAFSVGSLRDWRCFSGVHPSSSLDDKLIALLGLRVQYDLSLVPVLSGREEPHKLLDETEHWLLSDTGEGLSLTIPTYFTWTRQMNIPFKERVQPAAMAHSAEKYTTGGWPVWDQPPKVMLGWDLVSLGLCSLCPLTLCRWEHDVPPHKGCCTQNFHLWGRKSHQTHRCFDLELEGTNRNQFMFLI